MATRFFNRLLSVPRNYLIRVEEGFKADNEISSTLEGRASVLGALEAERSRKLGRDLIIHLIFFGVFIAILFMQRDVSAVNDINNSITAALVTQQINNNLQPFPKTYYDIGQWDEYEDYIMGVFVPGIQTMQDYSGRNLTEDEMWMVQYVNKVVGKVRVRQMRVKNDSCKLSKQFKSISKTCYSQYYTRNSKAKEPFGPPDDPTKYKYVDHSGGVELYANVRGLSFWDTSGYIVDIPLDENFGNRFQELIDDDFWGAPTRAMLITVTLTSPNYNDRATVLYLLTEFTAGGLANPYVQMRTFRIAMYIGDATDSFRAFLELLFMCFLVFYIFQLIKAAVVAYRLKRFKDFLSDLWNVIEFANIVLFLASSIMYLQYLGSKRTHVDLTQPDYIVALEQMGEDAVRFYQISAINILLSALKIFKYLQLSPRLYILWETMYEARIDMATYMVMFMIILLGFLLFGWLTFGPDIIEFNGFANSLGTLWQFLIGNPPDYQELQRSNRILGPVYYALFTIFVFFILVNMFVAIVSNSYEAIYNREVDRKTTITSNDIKRPLIRLAKTAKAIYKRKPLYSETELLRMLQHKNLLDKDTLTKQEIAQELKNMGEEPLSLYIERILAIHTKRKKFKAELQQAEKEKKSLEMEDELDRRVFREESLGGFNMGDIDLEIIREDQLASSNAALLNSTAPGSPPVLSLDPNQNPPAHHPMGASGGSNPASPATPNPTRVTLSKNKGRTLLSIVQAAQDANASNRDLAHSVGLSHRMDALEAKLDTILRKLDAMNTNPQPTTQSNPDNQDTNAMLRTLDALSSPPPQEPPRNPGPPPFDPNGPQ